MGWAMVTHLRTELVLDALDMALWQRRPEAVIHHSDQGTQPELNRSSQRSVSDLIVATRSTLRQEFASRGSSAAEC